MAIHTLMSVAGSGGQLIFYDFGMMGEIVPATRGQLLDLFYGVAKKDVNLVRDIFCVQCVYCVVLLISVLGNFMPRQSAVNCVFL